MSTHFLNLKIKLNLKIWQIKILAKATKVSTASKQKYRMHSISTFHFNSHSLKFHISSLIPKVRQFCDLLMSRALLICCASHSFTATVVCQL